MKITTIATTPEQVKQTTLGYFQTSVRDSSLVQQLIGDFSQYPRFFAEMTNSEIESSHFTSWFNVLSLRHYANPWIGDLYLVHEIAHMVNMVYVQDSSWLFWCNKVKQNETLASIYSEILIYFEMPSLREKTFDHPIWVDKILSDKHYSNIYKSNPRYFIELMYQARMNTMMNPQDFVDQQIANYNSQNSLWCDIWRNDFNTVETHMAGWQLFPDVDLHIAWLKSQSNNVQGPTFTPFEIPARQFADAYKQIRQKYGNENLKK